ncbi:hypothetical protein WOLCODRAFT_88050 [Wolfiporia cocos MD-104 SS10]|uniref:Auxin efflux carrier n=1 Tax=Wolfiporia cocos (strain MD-104) TaxID=742152 RepID=A0A2H3JHZ2_WOLCO|nr:hypothetical protein WOLCODRAFT_88050 [Wolfiporia cocos MD-104 SS10]
MAPIVSLLKTVLESIAEVFVLCLAGYVLARRGVLDRNAQKLINRVNVSLFTPSLLFSKVAFFLSPAKLRELWVIPIVFVITTGVSMFAAYSLAMVMRLQKSQRNFAIAAAMFMNSNSLPIALMQSLAVTVPDMRWGPDDNKDAVLGRALTYLVLYSVFGMVLRWSYGVRLLASADPDAHEEPLRDEASPLLSADETAFPNSQEEEHILRHEPSTLSAHTDGSATIGRSPHGTLVHLPPAEQTCYGDTSGSGMLSDTDDDDTDSAYPLRRPVAEPTFSLRQSRLRRAGNRVRRAWSALCEFMTAPLWAALASLLVACIQPLQHLLDEHVETLKGAVTMAGQCSVPLTLVVLGAYFYNPPDESSNQALPYYKAPAQRRGLFDSVKACFSKSATDVSVAEAPSSTPRPGETRTVVVAILSRMVITPLVLIPVLILCTKYRIEEVFSDPVFVVCNVLLITSPPALTLAQITQAASGDAFERLISRTIFWAYCLVTPPSTIIFVVVGLLIAKV